jgi:hypothetical protein
MPRQKRADEAGSIYHALNRGNARQTIFHKDEDYEAFLRVLGEGSLHLDYVLRAWQSIWPDGRVYRGSFVTIVPRGLSRDPSMLSSRDCGS